MRLPLWLVLPALFFFLFYSSCKKDVFDKSKDATLSFSVDTLYFDTVFTTLGSVTKRFLVYNKGDQAVKISKIRLAGGSSSPFRLNVDGIPGDLATDVEIEANDSIFIFAEVTINPNNEQHPFVVLDSINFELNGNLQDVKLMAYGRNARFYRPTEFPKNGFPPYSVSECDAHWSKDLPVVIIGYLAIDSACKLTIDAGTQIYLYNNSGLWIIKNGTIEVNGTREDSVVFQGVRKESVYQQIAGQWDRIWINQGNTINKINYAVIKNGNIGIQAEFVPELGPGPLGGELVLSNTRIRNMKAFGLYGVNYKITTCYNNIISNCGSYAMALIGGNYNFRHCTVANFWTGSVRTEPSVYLSNGKLNPDETITPYPLVFRFKNGIVYGNKQDENELDIGRVNDGIVGFDWKFENSLLRLNNEDINQNDPEHFSGMIFNSDPQFVDAFEQAYGLKGSSPARNAGNPEFVNSFPPIPEDILGNNRLIDQQPDLGAIEYTP
jgi:hypothetical protein